MTLLLDLPPETFGQVIAYYIHTIELPEAFRARTVCHAFAGAINDELLAEDAAKIMDYGKAGSSEYGWEGRLPIAREDRCRLSDADIDGADKTSTIFLRNNAIALLTNSVQRGVQTSIPIFINEVADDLMRFAPEATRAKIPPNHTQRNTSSLQHTEFYVTRNRYVDSLCGFCDDESSDFVTIVGKGQTRAYQGQRLPSKVRLCSSHPHNRRLLNDQTLFRPAGPTSRLRLSHPGCRLYWQDRSAGLPSWPVRPR
jgi:hypothetical protein